MTNEGVQELSNGAFDDFIKEGIVLIDFFAEWCMPCVMMAPVIDELSEKIPEVKFGKVNVSDNPAIAQKFNVNSIPNFTIFKDGKVVDKIIGAVPEEEIEDRLKEFI